MDENMTMNEEFETEDYAQDEVKTSGSGKLIGLALAGVAGVAAAGAVVAKKLKAKKKAKAEGKPKTKKKLRWVEVPVEEDVVDVESKDIDEEEK